VRPLATLQGLFCSSLIPTSWVCSLTPTTAASTLANQRLHALLLFGLASVCDSELPPSVVDLDPAVQAALQSHLSELGGPGIVAVSRQSSLVTLATNSSGLSAASQAAMRSVRATPHSTPLQSLAPPAPTESHLNSSPTPFVFMPPTSNSSAPAAAAAAAAVAEHAQCATSILRNAQVDVTVLRFFRCFSHSAIAQLQLLHVLSRAPSPFPAAAPAGTPVLGFSSAPASGAAAPAAESLRLHSADSLTAHAVSRAQLASAASQALVSVAAPGTASMQTALIATQAPHCFARIISESEVMLIHVPFFSARETDAPGGDDDEPRAIRVELIEVQRAHLLTPRVSEPLPTPGVPPLQRVWEEVDNAYKMSYVYAVYGLLTSHMAVNSDDYDRALSVCEEHTVMVRSGAAIVLVLTQM
jgi:hypothetical protein